METKPPNLATCCRHHLLGRPPRALGWGSSQGCGEGAKAAGGTGDSPAGGKSRAVALSPFSGCPSRLDLKSDTSGMSIRAQSRGRAPRRGSGCGCSGRALAGGAAWTPTQTAALPHRHRGLRGPVTPLRGSASFRSAGDHAGRGWAAPQPWLPPTRHPEVRVGPDSPRSCSLERPPGSRHLRTAPRPLRP